MNKTRLTNDMRRRTTNHLIEATFRERMLRLEQREHALALRVLRRELGEDALIRIAALPPGWLPIDTELQFDNHAIKLKHELYPNSRRYVLRFAAAMPVPSFVTQNKLEVGPESVAEIEAFAADWEATIEERDQLSRQVVGTLGGFYTVEALAEGWPEGYLHFPHPELAPETLPAMRIADINERLAAAREAA